MSDPTQTFPAAARPWAVIGWGTLVYGLVVSIPASSVWVRYADEGSEIMLAWGLLGVGFALPVGMAVGALAAGRERLITRLQLSGRMAWLGYGLGAIGLAHWAVMVPFSVVALFIGMGRSGARAVSYFESASWGLVAWAAVAISIGVLFLTRRGFQLRGREETRVRLPEIPHVLPSAGLVGLLAGPLMGVATAWVAEAGDGRGEAISMIFFVGGIGLIAGLGLAWSGAAAETAASRGGGRPVTWFGAFGCYLGAFLGVQWGAAFLVTLLPAWDSAIGQRFILQVFCVVVLACSAALVGRGLLRVESTHSPG